MASHFFATLGYILSPDDRDKAIATIVDRMKHYDLKETYRLPYGWNRWLPASDSLACATHALDIVYEDLDPFERAYVLTIIQGFVDMLHENESEWGHVWAHYGVLITWKTFNRRYNKVEPYADKHHMWLERTTTKYGVYVGSLFGQCGDAEPESGGDRAGRVGSRPIR